VLEKTIGDEEKDHTVDFRLTWSAIEAVAVERGTALSDVRKICSGASPN
jgi:hypothetical protein